MTMTQHVEEISIKKIVPNDYNPRKHFDSARMAELTKSVGNQGIIQAITVRPISNGKFEVVAGIRRFRAATASGLKKIPCLVRKMDDKEARLVSMTENLERADLTPIEEARAYADYLDWDEQKAFEGKLPKVSSGLKLLAENLPIGKATIYKRLNLLLLPLSTQTMIEQGTLNQDMGIVISSLRKLWKSKTANLSEEEIEGQRSDIKAQIHDKMMEVVEANITDRDRLKSYVNDVLKTEKQNLERRAEHLAEFKEKYDEALETLDTCINQSLEKYPDLSVEDLSEVDKAKTIIKHLDKLLESETRLDEISSERAWAQSQQDKILVNIAYVKEHALEFCPYCAASINVEAMNRKKKGIEEEIQSFYEEEETIDEEQRGYRDSRKILKEILADFEARKESYEQQKDISDGLSGEGE